MNNFMYEYNRDNKKSPLCWKSINDNCLPHFHSSIEIIYVTSGEIKASLNGQVYVVKQMDFLIVPSYTIHIYTTELSSSSYVFTIPLDTIPSFKATFYKKTFASLLIENPQYGKELKHCLDAICALPCNTRNLYNKCDLPNDSYSPVQENIVKGYTYVFLGILVDHIGLIDIPNIKITSLTQEILNYLQDNYLKLVSLEEISEHFGYSKSRFSHIFNEYFGCKLIEYINGLRCRYALELLQEKRATTTDIALASGFDSTRTFYRAFQKCFGCTPSEYLLQ